MIREFDWDQKLKDSDGVCESRDVSAIILENIVGSLSVTRAHSENDRSGTDWWVECRCGRHLSVDAKVRDEDYKPKGHDDLALETWSVVDKKIGWTLDENKRCDYVLWLWKDTGRWCMVPFPMLCAVFKEHRGQWCEQHKVAQQHTRRGDQEWNSECVFVPRRDVWAAIYNRFGCGQLNRE